MKGKALRYFLLHYAPPWNAPSKQFQLKPQRPIKTCHQEPSLSWIACYRDIKALKIRTSLANQPQEAVLCSSIMLESHLERDKDEIFSTVGNHNSISPVLLCLEWQRYSRGCWQWQFQSHIKEISTKNKGPAIRWIRPDYRADICTLVRSSKCLMRINEGTKWRLKKVWLWHEKCLIIYPERDRILQPTATQWMRFNSSVCQPKKEDTQLKLHWRIWES